MNRDTIKMLAMVTMLVNHIANVFMPAGAPLTNLCLYIGYFTAVTMCYFLVEGYGYTHSKTQYAGRLFGFAVLAQLPYQLVFPEHGMAGMLQFNMLFTLLLCFLVLAAQEKIHSGFLRVFCIVLLIFASIFCDWALLAPVFTLLFAYNVRFLAVSLQTVEAGLGKIKPTLDNAGRSLGLSPLGVLQRLHLPLMKGSLLTAILLVFVDVLKELPATLILRPFNFNTLAVRAYELASDERLADAGLPSLMIVAAGIIPVILLSRSISKSRAGEH